MGTGWFALVARRTLRRRIGAHALVAMVVALGFGVAIGAVAVADATDRAYPDYVRDAHVNRLVVNPSVATPEVAAAIRGFDGVSAVHTDDMFFGSFAAAEPGTLPELLASPHSEDELWMQVRGSVDGRYADTDRPAVTQGRLPTGSLEVFVSDEFRRPLEQIVEHPVELGDVLDLAFWPAGLDRAEVEPSRVFEPLGVERLRVVGFGHLPDEVVPAELFPRQRVVVSPDVARRYACEFDLANDPLVTMGLDVRADCSTQYRYFSLDVADDPAVASSVRSQFEDAAEALAAGIPQELREVGAGYYFIAQNRDDADAAVLQMTRPPVAVLVVFAILAALVTLTVAGFAMVRLARRAWGDVASLRPLGATRRELAAVLGAPLAAWSLLGLVGAVGVAAAISTVGPVGRVSVLGSDGHVRLPVHIVVPMAAVTLVLLLAATAIVGWVVSGTHLGSARRSVGAPWSARVVQLGRRPATGLGMRSALGGATRSDVAVLASSVVVVAVTAACVVFGVNLSSLASDSERYGWEWDAAAVIGGGYGDGEPAAIDATLADDDRVESYSLLAFDSAARLDGDPLPLIAGFRDRSPISLPVISGRMPVAAGEVLVGRASAEAIGLAVGDVVPIEVPGAAVELGFREATVVGIGVLPTLGQIEADVTGLGRGAYLVVDGEPPVGVAAFVGIELADGVDPAVFMGSIGEQLPTWSEWDEAPITYTRPVRPPDVVNVGEMRNAPLVLGAVLGLALLLGSTLAVSVSVRERRREFAVLRSLGFVRRELIATVRWQAITTAFLGVLIGLPLGIVAGRVAWRGFASGIGVVPAAEIPVVWVTALAAAVVALTLLAAVVPGRLAARTSPAVALRGA